MGLFSKIKAGLSKTRTALSDNVTRLINSFTKIDEELFEELEEILIMSDIGYATAMDITGKLRAKIKEDGVTDPDEIKGLLKNIIAEIISGDSSLNLETLYTIFPVNISSILTINGLVPFS